MINKETFCVAPWFMIRNDNDGTFKPCAVADFIPTHNIRDHSIEDWRNSDYMCNLRKEILHNKADACKRCWHEESIGVRSQRQIINNLVQKGRELNEVPWLVQYFKQKKDYKADLTIISDIKTGNNCNLQCAMCHPWDSSKIYTDWKNNPHPEFTINDPAYYEEIKATYKTNRPINHLDELFEYPLTFLKILGGEPLLDQRILDRLLALPKQRKQKLRLCFVTNGMQDMVEYAKQLQDFEDVYFSVSIDGFGSMNDYIRKNSNWTTIFNNLMKVLDSDLAEPSLSITVQALNIFCINELLELANHYNINVDFGWVLEPNYLSLAVIPPETLKAVRLTHNALYGAFENSVYNKELHAKFLRYIEWYERDFPSNMKLKHIEPRFYS